MRLRCFVSSISLFLVMIGVAPLSSRQAALADAQRTLVPYKLTPENLTKLLDAVAALGRLDKAAPRAGTGVSVEFSNIAESAAKLEEDAGVRRVFGDLGWTASDFLWTLVTTNKTLLVISLRDSGELTDVPREVGNENVDFLLSLPPELRRRFDAWTDAVGLSSKRQRK